MAGEGPFSKSLKMRPRHRVLTVYELLQQILLFLTSPQDLLHTALVCRSFVGAALHVLWRAHQFNLGPLLRCAPKLVGSCSPGPNPANVSLSNPNQMWIDVLNLLYTS